MKFGNCLLLKTKKYNTCFENSSYKHLNNESTFFFCVYLKLINTYQSFNTKNTCKACFEK